METSEGADIEAEKNEAPIPRPNILELCRLCANTDNQFIPIFKGEGLEHDISVKLKKHLPIIEVSTQRVCKHCSEPLTSINLRNYSFVDY